MSTEPGPLTRAWWKVHGETVGAIGLVGDVMGDWGHTLANWSNRNTFTPRELEHLTRVTPPASTDERNDHA